MRDLRDDWTGTTSTAERKRRQNRLNQRAYRKRQQTLQKHISAPTIYALDGLCQDEHISPFNEQGPRLGGAASLPSCPTSLQPTALQRTVRHHPWIDLFPIPQMRDNMLNGIVAGILDEDELCADLLNVEDNREDEKPSLIVWGSPWDPQGWEASVAFLQRREAA
ncbi:hypothetical protein NKR23_g985 [Pleurostoma richardsiae]|uniref:BZIP domain-containing protein n=1 Tax=Pleurostoma richardsiae TaxID=41990 RepID=A0AA38S035_9PEZI|nr:hypothetical protein NKR23_g985 [Pleurostoma richardsiae]